VAGSVRCSRTDPGRRGWALAAATQWAANWASTVLVSPGNFRERAGGSVRHFYVHLCEVMMVVFIFVSLALVEETRARPPEYMHREAVHHDKPNGSALGGFVPTQPGTAVTLVRGT